MSADFRNNAASSVGSTGLGSGLLLLFDDVAVWEDPSGSGLVDFFTREDDFPLEEDGVIPGSPSSVLWTLRPFLEDDMLLLWLLPCFVPATFSQSYNFSDALLLSENSPSYTLVRRLSSQTLALEVGMVGMVERGLVMCCFVFSLNSCFCRRFVKF